MAVASPEPDRAPRHDAAGRAEVELVDMRSELREGHAHMLSRPLLDAMRVALGAGERVILFLNRRGTAAFVQCADCGTIRKCRRCDTALTYHQASRAGTRSRLECHYCGYSVQAGRGCPACGGKQVSRHGPGTQAVEEAVKEFFPQTRTLRWDSDAARSARDHIRIMKEFEEGESRVLVGTQMIAKGLDVPSVTLVGVVSADIGLAIPDFRAGERAFQVLAQVAGRAGRGARPGRVLIQTFQPEHYAVVAAAAQDYEAFYAAEIELRARYNNPPFTRIVRLMRSDPDQEEAHRVAQGYASALRDDREKSGDTGVEVFGPTPSFPFRLRGMYRWHVVLRGALPETLLDRVPPGRGWAVDVDPVSVT
jgi:primosomal protein N' (replication factor Y)